MTSRALLVSLAARRRSLQQDGFTLMELLTVVVIMGILAAIATPTILNQQSRARVIAANSTAIQAAQSCASLQITSQESSWATNKDPNIAAAVCPASGSPVTFVTAFGTASGISTEAEAVVRADGSTQLTKCAAGPGATPKSALGPKCEY